MNAPEPFGAEAVDPPFGVRTEHVADTCVVRVRGELDVVTAGRLRATLAHASGSEVWVDLSLVTFIDASGIGCLVAGKNHIEARGGVVFVMGARGIVRRVFDLCGLSDLLKD